MSWDVFVMDLPAGAQTLDDIPDDFKPGPLMSQQALVTGIREVAPDADFSQPYGCDIEGPGYSIEVHFGGEDPVEDFHFEVRGGDMAAGVVAAVIEHFGLRAIDTGRNDRHLFDPTDATYGLHKWREFRDRASGRPSPSE